MTKRGEEKKKRKKRRKVWKLFVYGWLWFCMDVLIAMGVLDFCVEISLFHF